MRGGEPEAELGVKLPEKQARAPRDRGGVIGGLGARCGVDAHGPGDASPGRWPVPVKTRTHARRQNNYKTSPCLLLRCESGRGRP